MNKRNLQNKELDRIGRKLLDAAKERSEEIEQTVSSRMLFETIKTRIEIERSQQISKAVPAGWTDFQFWNPQKAATAFLIIFMVGVTGLIGFSKFAKQQLVEQAAAPKIQPKIEQKEISKPSTSFPGDSQTIVKTISSTNESPKFVKQTNFTNKTLQVQKSSTPKPKPRVRLQHQQNESAGEFYALTFAGNPGEAGDEVRIVHAELSRSSLFALGVNLPIENESPKIKTDLLVGADGVARAIRIVN